MRRYQLKIMTCLINKNHIGAQPCTSQALNRQPEPHQREVGVCVSCSLIAPFSVGFSCSLQLGETTYLETLIVSNLIPFNL